VRDLASERLVLVAAGPEPLAVAREDERPRDVRDGTDHVDKVRLRGGRGGGRRRALPPRAPLVDGAVRVEQEVVALFLDRPARGDQVWLRVERTAGPSEDVAERLLADLPALLGVHHVAVAEEDQADAIVVSDPVGAREATRRIELDEIGQAEAGDAALEARRPTPRIICCCHAAPPWRETKIIQPAGIRKRSATPDNVGKGVSPAPPGVWDSNCPEPMVPRPSFEPVPTDRGAGGERRPSGLPARRSVRPHCSTSTHPHR